MAFNNLLISFIHFIYDIKNNLSFNCYGIKTYRSYKIWDGDKTMTMNFVVPHKNENAISSVFYSCLLDL